MESRTDQVIRQHLDVVIRGDQASRELARISSRTPATDDEVARLAGIVEQGIRYALAGDSHFGRTNDFTDSLVGESELSPAEADFVRQRIVSALWKHEPRG